MARLALSTGSRKIANRINGDAAPASKEALNARAKVGKPAWAMLVSSEGISMDSERLACAHRIEGVLCNAGVYLDLN